MAKVQEARLQQVESDLLDDFIVYCWVTKGKNGWYFIGSPYATKQKAEEYKPGRSIGDYEYALVRFDLKDIDFSKRV